MTTDFAAVISLNEDPDPLSGTAVRQTDVDVIIGQGFVQLPYDSIREGVRALKDRDGICSDSNSARLDGSDLCTLNHSAPPNQVR